MTTVAANDPVAVASAGVFRTDKPAAPTISVAAGINSAVATITGEARCTHYLYYKKSSDSAWQDGGSRSGDGTIAATELSNNVPYIFVAISKNAPGIFSLPSSAAELTLAAAAAESPFDELVKGTADDFLTEFAEPIVYMPGGTGSRSIMAIVDREEPTELEGGTGAQSTFTYIAVANDSTIGISSSEVNLNADKVEVSTKMGLATVEKRIVAIIYQDKGMMKLEVR
jgi:hypothetical protein